MKWDSWGPLSPIRMRKRADETGDDSPAYAFMSIALGTMLTLPALIVLYGSKDSVWAFAPLIIGIIAAILLMVFGFGKRNENEQ